VVTRRVIQTIELLCSQFKRTRPAACFVKKDDQGRFCGTLKKQSIPVRFGPRTLVASVWLLVKQPSQVKFRSRKGYTYKIGVIQLFIMAARQGFSGQLTQYGDDAKRSFISSAPPTMFGYRWFSNMNTTCTIKSAPPRTPEVMSLLSSKHGWLIKRNEQGVWQRRYCCVVPHTFLYYFDTEPGDGGLGDGPEPHYERFQDMDVPSHAGYAVPVGIIDMECYSAVNRLSDDEHIMELTGDAITNPDLRSFFFKGESREHCEEWTKAFLSDRHQALRDEREALKEVCDSFPLQLANMSNMIREAETKADEKETESYRIRSSAEEVRQQILELVREGIEGMSKVTATASFKTDKNSHISSNGVPTPNTPNSGRNRSAEFTSSDALKAKLKQHQREFMSQLELLQRDQNKRLRWMGGATESVSILVEMLHTIATDYIETILDKEYMERELSLKSHHSKSDYKNLEQRLVDQERQFAQSEANLKKRAVELEAAVKKLQKENNDLSSMLQNSQMELKIHSKKTKNKLCTLQEHKKILKKEVIDLRATLEEVKSELDVVSHQKVQLEAKNKKEKTRRMGLQENYRLLREQLTVQERVWGMMQSSIAGGSVLNGNGSVIGDHSVNIEEGAGEAGTRKKTTASANQRDMTQNTMAGLRVSNVGFHPRDVVVKRKVSGAKEDDASKESRGSWAVGSLADNDSDSAGTSLGDNSAGKDKAEVEKGVVAHPPLHPNSNLKLNVHERHMSRTDVSVMSEITTDRDIATTIDGDDVHVSDPSSRAKPTHTIVIDGEIDLRDDDFQREQERPSAGLPPNNPAVKKKPTLFLQTIPSSGDDSAVTLTGQDAKGYIKNEQITNDSEELRNNSRILNTSISEIIEPIVPKVSRNLCGVGDEVIGNRESPKTALTNFAECGRLSPTEVPTSEFHLSTVAGKGDEDTNRKQGSAALPPIPPNGRETRERPDRPPISSSSKPRLGVRPSIPAKPTLEELLNDSDDMSFTSAISDARMSSVYSSGDTILNGENRRLPVPIKNQNSLVDTDDGGSVVSIGSNASKLSVAE